MAYVPINVNCQTPRRHTGSSLRDHAAVLSLCFTGDMSSEDRVEGGQMPRQVRNQPRNPSAATARTQVFRVPPLPTCQRYNRRSTARKLSLRAVFMCGEGVGRDQIRDQESSQVSRRVSGRWGRIETNGPDWDGIGPARRRPPGRNPGGRTTSLRQGFIRLRLTQGGGNAHTCASHLDGSRAHYLHA